MLYNLVLFWLNIIIDNPMFSKLVCTVADPSESLNVM